MLKTKKSIKSSSVKKIFSNDDVELTDLTEALPEDFADAESTLTSDEVTDALEAIAGIADAVLEAEGREAEDLEYPEVLDLVEDVLSEPEHDEGEEMTEEDLAIESSVVNLTIATEEGQPDELTIISGEGEDDVDTVVGADDPTELITPAPVDAEPEADIAVVTNRKVDLSQAKTFKVAINSHWKDIDAVHKKAWDMAEEKTKASGKTPEMGSKYYGMVMALAKTYYNRLTKGEVWEEAAELGSKKILAVTSALKKVLSAVASNEKKKYWPGFNDNGEVYLYDHDEYVETFGEEPQEKDAVEASRKRTAAAIYQKQNPTAKIASSEDFDGATPPAADDTPGTDGNADGIEDEGLLADGPQIHSDDIDGSSKTQQDTDPLGEPVDFDSTKTEVLVLPDETGAQAEMEFVVVSNSISVLSKKCAGMKTDHLVGRVRPIANGKGRVFLKSRFLGLISVQGDFMKGIKNCRYSAFGKTKKGYVDALGNVYSSMGRTSNFLIASSTSNHSGKKAPAFDIVSALESAYVRFLKNSAAKTDARAANYYKNVAQRRAMFARKALQQNLALTQRISVLSKKATEKTSSISQLKQQMAEQQYLDELKQRDTLIKSSATPSHASSNIDFLSSLM